MNRFIYYLLILVFILPACQKDDSDNFENLPILEKLNSLDGVTAIEIDSEVGYGRSFQIDIIQPVDHDNQGGATFLQRMYLTHTDEDMPMVFAPSGYAARTTSNQEIAGIMQANCLNITHRYFRDATPSPVDWSYCTIEQSAADHHRIVELFKKIYTNEWISSGVSKSGSTCVFHKYYYPDDVDATIAYVTPFMFNIDDQRFDAYIKNIGSTECYQKLTNVQKIIFNNRDDILQLMNTYMQTSNYTWSLEPNLVLELSVMDYPFVFWQYFKIDCRDIPTSENSLQEIFDHVNSIVPVYNFSDYYISYYAAYYYQALTEYGAPGYDPAFYDGQLTSINLLPGANPNFRAVAPDGENLTYDGSIMSTIYSWLQTNGDKVIYIYGKNDPWTAGAIELDGSVDALFINQSGENHGVKITDLDNPEVVYNKLEEWLGIEIDVQYGGTHSLMHKELINKVE